MPVLLIGTRGMAEQFRSEICILVAESFELVRLGLRSLFKNHTSVRLVAETNCVEDILNLAVQYRPDVVLIDLQLNNGDCASYINNLLNACPQSKVLALSYNDCEQTYLHAFRSGVAGIIGKHRSSELLLKAIYAVYAGQVWFDRNITKLLWQAQFDANQALEISSDVDSKVLAQLKLSEGERHVAHLACKGLSAKEIGKQLFIAEKTVRNQLSIIYKKIGVKKQVELCLKAPLYNYFNASYILGINFRGISDK